MRDLATQIPNEFVGLKTWAGANACFAKAFPTPTTSENLLTAIVPRADGSYVPVAILNDRNEWMLGYLVSAGIVVIHA